MVKNKGFTAYVLCGLYGLYGLCGFFNFSYLSYFSRLNTANASNRCADLLGLPGSFSGGNVYQPVEFHPIRAGRFQIDTTEGKKTVHLTHPIEMMSTPVTQKQWAEVMGENPSRFKKGEHSILMRVNGKKIRMQPNNPVEQVTWWSVLVFANKLSEKYGFRPTYDLSGITWYWGTRAEDGKLKVESGEVKINAKGGVYDSAEGDIYYQAEGFRLPTMAEQEYIFRASGTNGKYYFGENEAKLKDHVWYNKNSNGTTHPVAQLEPLVIDGKHFYDVYGNVWEWSWSGFTTHFNGGVNPAGEFKGHTFHMSRGGGWLDKALMFRLHSQAGFNIRRNDYTHDVGFRLVRTINNP